MAKKLRRVRTPLWIVFVQLLVPWVAMGLIAVAASAAGAPRYAIFALAISGALVTTWVVYRLEKLRRRKGLQDQL